MSDITNIINSGQSYANSQQAKGSTELGKDDFLNLMITQMKYQDPLNPMDSNEYAAQLAQFSSLEQLTNLNNSVNESIDINYLLTQSINNTMTATLIGKNVKLSTNSVTINGQESADIGYNLPSDASDVTVSIYDNYGKLVRTIKSDKKLSGDSKLTWDFTDNNGKKLGNGQYTFEVNATSMNGTEMHISSYLIGKIDGVRFTENGTSLMIGNVAYNVAQITEIFDSEQGG